MTVKTYCDGKTIGKMNAPCKKCFDDCREPIIEVYIDTTQNLDNMPFPLTIGKGTYHFCPDCWNKMMDTLEFPGAKHPNGRGYEA